MEINFSKANVNLESFRPHDLPSLTGRFVRMPHSRTGPFGIEIDGKDRDVPYHVTNILDRVQPAIDQFLNHHVTVSFVLKSAYIGLVIIPIKIVPHHEIANLAFLFSQEDPAVSSLENWLRAERQLLAKAPDPTDAEIELIKSTVIPGAALG